MASIMMVVPGCGSLMAQMSTVSGGTGIIPTKAGTTNSSSTVSVLTVAGRVVNAVTGQPVPRALVRLNDRVVLADHEGKFEIPQFQTGNSSYALTVTKPGFYSSTEPNANEPRTVRAEDLSSALEVRMYPEALITGTVTGPDGLPIPRVNVMAQRSAYNLGVPEHTWMMAGQGFTNERGAFRMVVPAGDYRLQTTYNPRAGTGQVVLSLVFPGSSPTNKSNTVHLTAGSEQHFDLRPLVGRTYSVSIAVDSGGEGRFPVVVARSDDGVIIPVGMRPAGPGEMKAELPSGTYTLQATLHVPGPQGAEAMSYGETRLTVADHDVTGVTLHLAAVPPIPLVMDVDSAATSDKAPPMVQQLGLMLEATDSSQSSMFSQNVVGVSSSPDGTFRFMASPGSYRLETHNNSSWYVKAASYGTTDLLTQNLTVAAGADGGLIRLTVSDQIGRVRGMASLRGAPAQCDVYFVPLTVSGTSVYFARSGSDGTYNFFNLPPGSYRAIAFERHHSMNFRDPNALDAFATHVRTVTVAAGDKDTLDLDAVAESEVTP